MKLYIIAGEASGDLHGANLIKALKQIRPDADCRIWGGDMMQAAGGKLVKHYRDLAFMGFVEVLKNLRTILRNIAFCKEDILNFRPDALVLIDYPGFNLRIARWAKQQGIRVIYYISPQVWAWHQSRVHDIKRDVDKLLVILPFEKDFFASHGVAAEFVGHPLLDAIQAPPALSQREHGPIALLPGSRWQEVERILPPMLAATRSFPTLQFVVAGAQSLPESLYQKYISAHPNVSLVVGETYTLLSKAKAALVKSGTSTLETALFGVPEVVCYAGNAWSYAIARRLVTVKYISLVNLIVDRPLVTELIQHDLNEANLVRELTKLLDPGVVLDLLDGYAELRQRLGEGGASRRAAEAILGILR